MTADQSAQGNHQTQPTTADGAPNTSQLAAAVEYLNSQREADRAMMQHMQEVIQRPQDNLTAHDTAAQMMAAQWGDQQQALQQQVQLQQMHHQAWAAPNNQGPLGMFTLPALPGMPQPPAMPQFTQTTVKTEQGLPTGRPVVKNEPQGDAAGFDNTCAAAAETTQVKLERLKQEQALLETQIKQEQQGQAGHPHQATPGFAGPQGQAGAVQQNNLGFVETPSGIFGPEGEEMSRTALMEFITQQQALLERYSQQSSGSGNRMVLGRPGFRPGGSGKDAEGTASQIVKATGKKSAWPPHPSKAGYRFYCADEGKVKQKGIYAGWRKMENAFPAGESWESMRGLVNGFHTLDEATEWFFANYEGRAQVTIFR